MDRKQAYELVIEYTQNDSLRRHMLAVESAMHAYAQRFGEDEELWGLVGLLHDFDYERFPDLSAEMGHPRAGQPILEEMGVSEEIRRAILSHAEEYTGVKPESMMEKTLVAVDELTGFITAVTLVRPSKSISDVELKSIKKKWRMAAFAAPIDRDHIEAAAEAIGVSLDEHIQTVLDAMKQDAEALGLAGR